MVIECCAQERTYLRFYGSLGERFCMISAAYQAVFDESFAKQYAMIHRCVLRSRPPDPDAHTCRAPLPPPLCC